MKSIPNARPDGEVTRVDTAVVRRTSNAFWGHVAVPPLPSGAFADRRLFTCSGVCGGGQKRQVVHVETRRLRARARTTHHKTSRNDDDDRASPQPGAHLYLENQCETSSQFERRAVVNRTSVLKPMYPEGRA